MKAVEFYYGLGSRYSYIAATQISRIERETTCRFEWFPLYSGKLLERSAHNPFSPENRRGQYLDEYRKTDAVRWAAYYSIPFKEPDITGADWSSIARACLVAKSMGQVESYSLAVFGEVFGKGSPPKTADQLRKLASGTGLPGAEFEARLHGQEMADEEARIFEQATRSGVFGVPTFIVDGELFWGQDRIPLLVHHLSYSRGVLPVRLLQCSPGNFTEERSRCR